MNMKTVLFAGGGLMLSMVVTTIWIGNDMARIKEREAAAQQAKCTAVAGTNSAQTAPAHGTDLATGTGSTAGMNGPDCAPEEASPAGSQAGYEHTQPGMADPAVQPASPTAAPDPMAGQAQPAVPQASPADVVIGH